MNEVQAVITIAFRDVAKFVRDPARVIGTIVQPIVFVLMGSIFQLNLGAGAGIDLLAFIFTGVFAQTLFQSSSFGIISLIEDRYQDFSRELFIAPISRYSIVLGKIVGESVVALLQGVMLIVVGVVAGISLAPGVVLMMFVAGVAVCLLGGAFGILIVSNLKTPQATFQVFPFFMLPQYFLAGVFSPVAVLPLPLEVVSRISPLRYAVDLVRAIYYAGDASYDKAVLHGITYDLVAIAALFLVALVVGTALFVRAEQNR